jgi:hypothetical protein
MGPLILSLSFGVEVAEHFLVLPSFPFLFVSALHNLLPPMPLICLFALATNLAKLQVGCSSGRLYVQLTMV